MLTRRQYGSDGYHLFGTNLVKEKFLGFSNKIISFVLKTSKIFIRLREDMIPIPCLT